MKILLMLFMLGACHNELKIQDKKVSDFFRMKVPPEEQGIIKIESFYSKELGRNWDYSVYYPKNYSTDKKYPVIFMLHGAYGTHKTWIRKGKAKKILDKAVAAELIPETIVIFPRADDTWYADIPGTNMRSAFINDLFPYVETNFPVLNKKSARALGGYSMGGHGALIFALNDPDYFEAVFIFSPAITALGKPPTKALNILLSLQARHYVYGMPINQELWDKNSYHAYFENALKNKSMPKFFVVVGENDIITPKHDSLYLIDTLNKNKIEYQYLEVSKFGHSWRLWILTLPVALEFVGKNFVY